MGFDFINDDLVCELFILCDYNYEFVGMEIIDGCKCWKIKLVFKVDVVVVWGEIFMWID